MVPKRHLQRRRSVLQPIVAACGVKNPSLTTTNPAEVSCLGCQRTVLMADAEQRIRLKLNRKNNKFPRGKRSNQ